MKVVNIKGREGGPSARMPLPDGNVATQPIEDDSDRPKSSPPESFETTEIITGAQNVLDHQLRALSNAKKWVHSCIDAMAPSIAMSVEPLKEGIVASIRSRVKHQNLTEITGENLEDVRKLMEIGVEVRHLNSLKGNFVITESEYDSVSTPDMGRPSPMVIHSNARQIVEQHEYLFQTLWNQALSAEARIREIEQGIEAPRTVLLTDPASIAQEVKNSLESSNRLWSFTNSEGLRLALYDYRDQYDRILSRNNGEVRTLMPIENKRDAELVKKGLEVCR
jgi:hypothetical protein